MFIGPLKPNRPALKKESVALVLFWIPTPAQGPLGSWRDPRKKHAHNLEQLPVIYCCTIHAG